MAALPSSPALVNLIDEEALTHMKQDSILINVGRGSLVVESALVEALKQNRLLGAALDVTQEEPYDSSSVLFCPEIQDRLLLTSHCMDNSTVTLEQYRNILSSNYSLLLQDSILIN